MSGLLLLRGIPLSRLLRVVIFAAVAIMEGGRDVGAQFREPREDKEAPVTERVDHRRQRTADTVTVINGEAVVKFGLPLSDVGLRVGGEDVSPERRARMDAEENYEAGEIQPSRDDNVVPQNIDSTIFIEGEIVNDVKNITSTTSNKRDKACIKIGTVSDDGDCGGTK